MEINTKATAYAASVSDVLSPWSKKELTLSVIAPDGISVYASNDYSDMAEATDIIFADNVPVADASGTDKIYHYATATRYDDYDAMQAAGVVSVGSWNITTGTPVWEPIGE